MSQEQIPEEVELRKMRFLEMDYLEAIGLYNPVCI